MGYTRKGNGLAKLVLASEQYDSNRGMPWRSDQQMLRIAVHSKAFATSAGSYAGALCCTRYLAAYGQRLQLRRLKHQLLRPSRRESFNGKYSGRHVTSMTSVAASAKSSQQTKPQVVIITTVGCPFCQRAKQSLQQEQIEYEEIEAGTQLELLNKIKATTGRRTVPQVVAAACILYLHEAVYHVLLTLNQCHIPEVLVCRFFWEETCLAGQMTCCS